MNECIQTLDGKHHWGQRRWLARDARGRSLDQTVKENWHDEWACVCGALAPSSIIPALLEGASATRKLKSRRWGVETAVQGKLAL